VEIAKAPTLNDVAPEPSSVTSRPRGRCWCPATVSFDGAIMPHKGRTAHAVRPWQGMEPSGTDKFEVAQRAGIKVAMRLGLSTSTENLIDAYHRRVSRKPVRALVALKPPPRADELVSTLARSTALSTALREARLDDAAAVRSVIRTALNSKTSPHSSQCGDLLDMILSLRTHSAWLDIIHVIETSTDVFGGCVGPALRQIHGMALNRAGLRRQAEQVSFELIARYGANAESLGILGRVYKDRFAQARDPAEKERWLRQAISVYTIGALCNPGEIYPLINVLTLILCYGKIYPQFALTHLMRLLYDRFRSGFVDYFDIATGLEVSVILRYWGMAEQFLRLTLCVPAEAWQLETTANNLALLASAAPTRDSHLVFDLAKILRATAPRPRVVDQPNRVSQNELKLALQFMLEMSN
jgi:hypothetical protein